MARDNVAGTWKEEGMYLYRVYIEWWDSDDTWNDGGSIAVWAFSEDEAQESVLLHDDERIAKIVKEDFKED